MLSCNSFMHAPVFQVVSTRCPWVNNHQTLYIYTALQSGLHQSYHIQGPSAQSSTWCIGVQKPWVMRIFLCGILTHRHAQNVGGGIGPITGEGHWFSEFVFFLLHSHIYFFGLTFVGVNKAGMLFFFFYPDFCVCVGRRCILWQHPPPWSKSLLTPMHTCPNHKQ